MLQFIYPQPEQKEPTISDKLSLLHSFKRHIDNNAKDIAELERLIANPSDIQNLFRNTCETQQELKDAVILRDRLKRMWNRQLNDLIIR